TWRIGRLDRFCTDVVPHEIFHILLAHNRGQITPRCWDEGFAQLTESREAQEFFWKKGIETYQTNRGIPLSRLIPTPDYLPDMEAQYAQSYMVSLYVYNHFGNKPDALNWVMNGHNIQELGYPTINDFHVNYMEWVKGKDGIESRKICQGGQCRMLGGIKKFFTPNQYPWPPRKGQPPGPQQTISPPVPTNPNPNPNPNPNQNPVPEQ